MYTQVQVLDIATRDAARRMCKAEWVSWLSVVECLICLRGLLNHTVRYTTHNDPFNNRIM